MNTALAYDMGQDEFTSAICGALKRAFGDERAAVKRIATVANSNLRAAENWLSGKNPPNGLHLARLVQMVPEVASEWRRITAMDANMDPELQRDMTQLLQTASRILAAKGEQ